MKLPDKLPALADQVCTIEQSRKLWELGVQLECLFEWQTYRTREEITHKGQTVYMKEIGVIRSSEYVGTFPAYTGSELDHLLPFICGCVKLRRGYKMRRLSGSWFDDKPPHPTPAIAKADLLIHLIEEGEVTL